jgi:hypothetical protein
MVSPVAQTAHLERPQGFLAPPDPQLASTPSQTVYVGPTGAALNYSIPLSAGSGSVRVAQKIPIAQLMAPTQDPQAARLERPALNLDPPRHKRAKRTLASHGLAPEDSPVTLDARAKIPKPQPQTARAMATGDGSLGGPQMGDALDNGHPVDAGSSPAGMDHRVELTALLDPRGKDKETAIGDSSSQMTGVENMQSSAGDHSDDEEDTASAPASILDSRASRMFETTDSSVMALMATTLSALVLVAIL